MNQQELRAYLTKLYADTSVAVSASGIHIDVYVSHNAILHIMTVAEGKYQIACRISGRHDRYTGIMGPSEIVSYIDSYREKTFAQK